MTTLTIDENVLKEAKEKGLNLSEAAEDGIIRRLNRIELQDNTIYDDVLAQAEPEFYWIDPKDNKCKKRMNEQFFIHENGAVFPVTKADYLKWKGYYCKKPGKRDVKDENSAE